MEATKLPPLPFFFLSWSLSGSVNTLARHTFQSSFGWFPTSIFLTLSMPSSQEIISSIKASSAAHHSFFSQFHYSCSQLIPSNMSYSCYLFHFENILSFLHPGNLTCSQLPAVLHTVLVLPSRDGKKNVEWPLSLKFLLPVHFLERFCFFVTSCQIPRIERMNFYGLLANCPI